MVTLTLHYSVQYCIVVGSRGLSKLSLCTAGRITIIRYLSYPREICEHDQQLIIHNGYNVHEVYFKITNGCVPINVIYKKKNLKCQ